MHSQEILRMKLPDDKLKWNEQKKHYDFGEIDEIMKGMFKVHDPERLAIFKKFVIENQCLSFRFFVLLVSAIQKPAPASLLYKPP